MNYKILDKPYVPTLFFEYNKFEDQGLYQYPTQRGYWKYKNDNFIDIQSVRDLSDYDGEIRTNVTFYATYPKYCYASGAQPHVDVKSCLATHVIPIDASWRDEFGGSLKLYERSEISNEYKAIMQKLTVENPNDEDLLDWHVLKRKTVNFKHSVELKMNDDHSIMFNKTWHSVSPLKTDKIRTVLIVTYHKKNMKCMLGD